MYITILKLHMYAQTCREYSAVTGFAPYVEGNNKQRASHFSHLSLIIRHELNTIFLLMNHVYVGTNPMIIILRSS